MIGGDSGGYGGVHGFGQGGRIDDGGAEVVAVVAVPSLVQIQAAAGAVMYKATGESDVACLLGALACGTMWE